jgi:galactofuranosylgalactofuranosylrhamnosyl-N-acetylglucosaminyl-diphospho-decaprenol beta-1,5/1,6-galactofuranosyltransferase
VPHADREWWLLARLDSALVPAAEGTSVAWYRRDRRRFWSLLLRTAVLHTRLLFSWPRLRARYQQSLPGLVSSERWRETFASADRELAASMDLIEGRADDRSPVEAR